MIAAERLEPSQSPALEVWRCAGCRRIVAQVAGLYGRIDIKCKCGTMNSRDIR